jgi:hypothetical protein
VALRHNTRWTGRQLCTYSNTAVSQLKSDCFLMDKLYAGLVEFPAR